MLVEITRLSRQGEGIACPDDGPVVFVPRTLPGEQVKIEIIQNRRNWRRGTIQKIVRAAADRIEPSCPHYQDCGGCAWLHAPEEMEAATKAAEVRRMLEQVAGTTSQMAAPLLLPRVGSRDRMRVRWHHGQAWFATPRDAQDDPRPLPSTGCPTTHPELNRTLQNAAAELRQAGHEGAGELIITRGDGEQTSWLYKSTEGATRRATDSHPTVDWYGGTLFNVPSLFFQPSITAARALAETLRSWTTDEKATALWDFFGGQGGLARALAERCTTATVVEGESKAGTMFQAGSVDAKVNWQKRDLERSPRIKTSSDDWIIMDPPRTGLTPTMQEWLRIAPGKKLFMVSCDPATMTRDLQKISGRWQLHRWRMFNMYPGTAHLEVICELLPRV